MLERPARGIPEPARVLGELAAWVVAVHAAVVLLRIIAGVAGLACIGGGIWAWRNRRFVSEGYQEQMRQSPFLTRRNADVQASLMTPAYMALFAVVGTAVGLGLIVLAAIRPWK